jgi:GxxExxY protein
MALLYPQESYDIRGASYEIYKVFRNNHKEIVYHRALFDELLRRGYNIEKNKQIAVYFNNKKVGVYIPDLVVNNSIFIELKCKPFITKEDLNQFWYYLKNSNYQLGFLINFGAKDGVQIMRRIYTVQTSA